jgi:hypothetical protein
VLLPWLELLWPYAVAAITAAATALITVAFFMVSPRGLKVDSTGTMLALPPSRQGCRETPTTPRRAARPPGPTVRDRTDLGPRAGSPAP